MLRFPELHARIGISRSTVDRLERVGRFPVRKRLGERIVAWVEEEVDVWMKNQESKCAPPTEGEKDDRAKQRQG